MFSDPHPSHLSLPVGLCAALRFTERRPVMRLTEGLWRRPMWAPGNVLRVPADGPWAYLSGPGGGDHEMAILIGSCEQHDDFEPVDGEHL